MPPRLQIRLDSSRPDEADRWRFAAEATAGTPMLVCDRLTAPARLTIDGRTEREWDEPLAALDALPRLAGDAPGRRWVGYLSYDLGRLFEDLPAAPPDDLGLPLFAFVLVDSAPAAAVAPRPSSGARGGAPPLASTFTRNQYERAVARAIEYIRAGDIFQVNLSQRFTSPLQGDPLETYARLAAAAPAAYGAFLDFGDHQLLSNSPELFFDVRRDAAGRRTIVNRPIKGTRPRGPGMEEALRRSAKDQAELAMIVDLQRNDLGRVCRIGSVRVVEPRAIEAHPTVYHGVATVCGELRADVGVSDLLRAVFPCGSITGCPKIRAMQIIDELEPVGRGPYCGAVGWIDGRGEMQFNVAIRTMISKAGQVYFAVGGGVVADSDPSAEYEETLHKARAMLDVLGIVG